ncbi:helix-turn-helix domain-containing protein [Microlunatus panaciterrae]|uniref:AraC family transcriptional regulator of arabinose operon n=1 Tax=Microlunatus panaciterrae TaxID=400768 RepID=A0ABS2RMJ1_9ACTN|nr:helix-turn-helix domain-containing protein [Microlunatus panaciterrae]MBM7799411.1 AraC family transcriptional regulator of arabinose operon [Microlunatus panaciterrae]
MSLRDPATPRPESFTPTVARLLVGELDEGAGYTTYRSRGTSDWLLFHTLEGEGRLGTATTDVRALPGETTLIRPGTPHDYGVEPRLRHWHFRYAHFHPRPEWSDLLSWPEVAPGILQLRAGVQIGQRIAASLADSARLSTGVLANSELLSLNAFEAALLWCDSVNPSRNQIDERLLRAIELVDRDLRADLGVSRLARASTLSVSRFAHLFRRQLGVSPQRFVERRRLDTAARLLDMTSRPVSSVAAEVGFTNPLYFSTRFRQQTGMSPSAYRARRTPSTSRA